MESLVRRDFLKTAGSATALGVAGLTVPARVLGANDRVRIAIIGLRGRGLDHIKGYAPLKNVEIAALCDVDENVLTRRLGDAEKLTGHRPAAFGDVRKLLADKSIDAISIATPNHWHSLIGIWGAQAGKDIYCEKPCCHNWWEGKQLVAAVKKYKVMCQHGSQSRSGKGIRDGIQAMRDGLIGDVYLSRALCFKWRDTIGHQPVQPVPAGVNYDLWTGPSPLHPFTLNRFHYNWHWFWDTGNGDLGNQAIHELDIARWGLGVGFPNRVSAMGGKFMFHDDQETPNTLTASFEFDQPDGSRRMLEAEVRHWITNPEAGIGTGLYHAGGVPAAGLAATPRKHDKQATHPKLGPSAGAHNCIGNEFYGSKGYIGMDGYDSFKSWLGPDQTPGPESHGGGDHFQNFIDVVRSRRYQDLHCPIEEGFLSSSLIHLANASYRLGRSLNFNPETQAVLNDSEAEALLHGTYRAPYVVPDEV